MSPWEGTVSTEQGPTQSVLAQDHLSCSLGTVLVYRRHPSKSQQVPASHSSILGSGESRHCRFITSLLTPMAWLNVDQLH